MRALILGGTGTVGRAVARRLLGSGWEVDLTGRDASRVPADLLAAGARFSAADRYDPAALGRLMGRGADLVVDCLCFTAAHARQLVQVLPDAGSAVMLSSKAVYVDEQGRHMNSDQPPVFAGPVAEDQPTVPPGDGGYDSRGGYGPNKVAAEQVLLDSGFPVTVLRASKVHGEGASPAREWVFVRRVLAGRRTVFLASLGQGTDHTTAAVNTAALVECVAGQPGARILNSADPDAPSALEISRTVAGYFGHGWEEILLPGTSDESGGVGAHPWETAAPIVLDTSAAGRMGYVPVGTYAETVTAELQWLAGARRNDPSFAGSQSDLDRYLADAAEDRFLSLRP